MPTTAMSPDEARIRNLKFNDLDGMTQDRAKFLVLEVRDTKDEILALFHNHEIDAQTKASEMARLRLKMENINVEARRLNVIKQQKIVGVMGLGLTPPPLE